MFKPHDTKELKEQQDKYNKIMNEKHANRLNKTINF